LTDEGKTEKIQGYGSDFYGPVTGIGSRRIVIEGKMSVNAVDSAKWGREVHIQVYASTHRNENRNPSRWSRAEIYIPLKDLGKLIDTLVEIQMREVGAI